MSNRLKILIAMFVPIAMFMLTACPSDGPSGAY